MSGAKANAEYKELSAKVGSTLSSWMAVEVQMQQTFSIAIGGDRSSANAIFKAATNSGARLSMVNEAVTHALRMYELDEALHSRWDRLFERSRRLAKRRNRVAHGQPTVIMSLPDQEGNNVGLGARIVDPLRPLAVFPDPQKALNEGISPEQLNEMAGNFHKLAFDVFQHGQELDQVLSQVRKDSGE